MKRTISMRGLPAAEPDEAAVKPASDQLAQAAEQWRITMREAAEAMRRLGEAVAPLQPAAPLTLPRQQAPTVAGVTTSGGTVTGDYTPGYWYANSSHCYPTGLSGWAAGG